MLACLATGFHVMARTFHDHGSRQSLVISIPVSVLLYMCLSVCARPGPAVAGGGQSELRPHQPLPAGAAQSAGRPRAGPAGAHADDSAGGECDSDSAGVAGTGEMCGLL